MSQLPPFSQLLLLYFQELAILAAATFQEQATPAAISQPLAIFQESAILVVISQPPATTAPIQPPATIAPIQPPATIAPIQPPAIIAPIQPLAFTAALMLQELVTLAAVTFQEQAILAVATFQEQVILAAIIQEQATPAATSQLPPFMTSTDVELPVELTVAPLVHVELPVVLAPQ